MEDETGRGEGVVLTIATWDQGETEYYLFTMRIIAVLAFFVAIISMAQGSTRPKHHITFEIRKIVACSAGNPSLRFRGDSSTYCVSEVIVDEAGVASAQPDKDPSGHVAMKLFFTPEATEALRRHVTVHDEIAVVIDGEPVLHVLVMDDLGSEEVISGDFARSEIDAWITGFRELRRKRQNARRT